jgi:hypothetical protein
MNIWKDFGVYLFCLLGTLTTKAIPDLTATDAQIVLPTWQTIVVSMVLSLVVVAIGESKGDLLGKRANFRRRAFKAFLLGVFAIEITEKFVI